MPNRPMIKNGPKMRLNSAPGRRTTSMTSLPMNEVVLVQLLSAPSHSSVIARNPRLLLVGCRAIGAGYQRGENLVERGTVLAARDHVHAHALQLLQQAGYSH